ncbi:hypothetical protein HRG_012482 [Hirsutella rhossiliensis]
MRPRQLTRFLSRGHLMRERAEDEKWRRGKVEELGGVVTRSGDWLERVSQFETAAQTGKSVEEADRGAGEGRRGMRAVNARGARQPVEGESGRAMSCPGSTKGAMKRQFRRRALLAAVDRWAIAGDASQEGGDLGARADAAQEKAVYSRMTGVIIIHLPGFLVQPDDGVKRARNIGSGREESRRERLLASWHHWLVLALPLPAAASVQRAAACCDGIVKAHGQEPLFGPFFGANYKPRGSLLDTVEGSGRYRYCILYIVQRSADECNGSAALSTHASLIQKRESPRFRPHVTWQQAARHVTFPACAIDESVDLPLAVTAAVITCGNCSDRRQLVALWLSGSRGSFAYPVLTHDLPSPPPCDGQQAEQRSAFEPMKC